VMECWDWDKNGNDAEYNDTLWPCSSGTAVLSNFPSRLLSPTNTAGPLWPQTYETSSLTVQEPILQMDKSAGSSDIICGDTVGWDYWDAWRDIKNKGYDGLNGTLEASPIRSDSTSEISPLDSSISSSTPHTLDPGSGESTRAVAGRADSSGRTGGSPTLRGAPSDQWVRGTEEELKSRYLVTTSYAGSSHMPAEKRIVCSETRAKQEQQLMDRESNPSTPTQTDPMSSRTTSIASSQAQSSPRRGGGTKAGTPRPGGEKRRRSHGQSEKNYRMKLDEQFSNLLAVIPDEMVEKAGHFKDRLTGEKLTSKATTLDLAVDYIQVLEAEEKKLMEEELVVGGQVAVYQRLVSGRGGHWQRWAESRPHEMLPPDY
ncbi:hypothetical protein N431DRAFT_327554, partial [Stipitochalara longipes BDJ]